jgi:putative ABC transport system ATP-binding protein
MPVENLLEVNNLCKSVKLPSGELKILSNLDFTIESNQTLAILGASGSGKSTLLSIMAGLDPEYDGSVKLFGNELKDLSEDERSSLRKNNVGFVFQSFLLIPELNALENICLPLEICGKFNRTELINAQLLLDKIGLSDRSKHYPNTLSGGEQQRIALARAFITKPKILFLDEPTGSLDFENGQRIVELLFDLNSEYGTTIVMVTHDTDISQQCDKVLVLKSGMLV